MFFITRKISRKRHQPFPLKSNQMSIGVKVFYFDSIIYFTTNCNPCHRQQIPRFETNIYSVSLSMPCAWFTQKIEIDKSHSLDVWILSSLLLLLLDDLIYGKTFWRVVSNWPYLTPSTHKLRYNDLLIGSCYLLGDVSGRKSQNNSNWIIKQC